MKKIVISFLSLILGAVLFAGCRSIPPPAGSGIPTGTSSSSSSSPSSSSAFFNSVAISPGGTSAAVAVGLQPNSGQGVILVSSGGPGTCGNTSGHFPCGTWKQPTSLPSSFNPLQAVTFDLDSSDSDSNVLAVGQNNTILTSTDGGETWTAPPSTFTCSTNTSVTLTNVNLNGASIFGQVGNPAVIVGNTFQDPCLENASIGLIAAASNPNFPYTNWQIIDHYAVNGTLQPIPSANFTGVSFTQGGSNSNFVLVVGYNSSYGYIFQGNTTTGLTNNLNNPSNNPWSLSSPPISGVQFNGAALAPPGSGGSSGGIAVGNNGVIYMNPAIGSTNSTWTQVPTSDLPAQAQTATFTGVHFSSGTTTAAVVTGYDGTPNNPVILYITSCCDASILSAQNISLVTPNIANLTGLFGVWGNPNGATLAVGSNGFILENDNGGSSSPEPWFQVNPVP